VLRWSDLDGHAATSLRSALAAGRLPHAYLFSGPSVVPQLAMAQHLARAINCQRRGGPGDPATATGPVGGDLRAAAEEPCGVCDACHKIEHGIHPDFITLQREGAAQLIPIETVRQVIARLGLPPHEAAVRVFLVEEAAALAGPSANALLKTLEEPPRRTLFLLCTVAPDGLLPTIRSRCQRVRFGDPMAPAVGGAASAGGAGAPGAIVDASAEARRVHLAELAAELAHPPHRHDLPARICEGKGDAVQVVDGALRVLHQDATAAARAGDLTKAQRTAARVVSLLDVHRGMTAHNAQPQLALEAWLLGWRT
jgi:DNA polymerase III delta' subunit